MLYSKPLLLPNPHISEPFGLIGLLVLLILHHMEFLSHPSFPDVQCQLVVMMVVQASPLSRPLWLHPTWSCLLHHHPCTLP